MTQRTFINVRLATRQDLQPQTWLHHEADGELKAQRLRAGLALAEAIELAHAIKNGSVTDLSRNLNLLTKRIEEAMYSLRPQGEENTPADYSKEVAS